MKTRLMTYIETARQNCLRATPASVFIGGVALLMTTSWYWIFFQISLLVHDLFPEPSPLDLGDPHWTTTARLAFELLVLGLLWRYPPKRIYQYWLVPMTELASPFVQCWKGVAKTVVTIVCVFSLSVGAAIAFSRLYDYKYRPARPSSHLNEDQIWELIRQEPILSSSATPCYSTQQEATSKPQE